MRKIFILIGLLATLFSSAQEVAKPEKLKDANSRDRLVFELNHTRWLEAPEVVDQKWYGRGMNLHFYYDFKIGKSPYFSIAPGAGISSHNVYHNNTILIDTLEGVNSSYFALRDTLYDYKVNKFNSNWLEVPIELRFHTKPDGKDRSFKLALGMRAGVLLSAKTKYRGEANLNGYVTTVREKVSKLPNISKYRFGPSVRIGYGEVSLVGFYSLTSLFQSNKGPSIKEFSIGVTFNSF